MPLDEFKEGERVMTVCNSCRYCEEFCPVFPAMERRSVFTAADLAYLANLCHNCGECLYACQYAPPHEFAINVPRTLSRLRIVSYEKYCWPAFMGAAFRRNGVATSIALSVFFSVALLGGTLAVGIDPWRSSSAIAGDFYSVISHEAMTMLFGSTFLLVLLALTIGVIRMCRELRSVTTTGVTFAALVQALRDLASLRHLHADGVNCTSNEEVRTPWRRWFHHCTFYGFMLCLASTSVASMYHNFGWHAPYPYLSLPVVLGTVGGLGLLVGPAGLLLQRRHRDADLSDPSQSGMDLSFIWLLFLTSLSGLLLLALRERSAMGPLLIWHLGAVLALFVTLPYGKFVHGIYRALALLNSAIEEANDRMEATVPGHVPIPPEPRFAPPTVIDSAVVSGRATAHANVERLADVDVVNP